MAESRNPWDAPTVEEVLGPVVAACPSFTPVWAEFVGQSWSVGDENGYSVTLELADHLIALLRRGETAEIRPTFDAIEGLLNGADSGLEELLTVHFLDDIQREAKRSGNWALTNGFIPFLGPQMREAWKSEFYRWKSENGIPPSL